MNNKLNMKYNWKLSGFAKGVDPVAAVEELERIESVLGGLTAENIVIAAMPEDSLFHNLFEWDDSQAANLYRLSQARTIINNIEVVVISDSQPRTVNAYEIVRKPQASVYKHVIDFSPDDVQEVKQRTIRELNYLKNKLSFYNQFQSVVDKLDDAISDLDNA